MLHSLAIRNEQTDLCPVLHIESHGSAQGLGVAPTISGMISWQELKPLLTRINVATKNNLLVTLSCCYGGYLASVIQPSERSPCWGLAGPVKEVMDLDLLEAYQAFYERALNGAHGNAAIKALNSHLPRHSPIFCFTISRDFFLKCYRKYLERFCTDAAIRDRAEGIQKRGRQHHPDVDFEVDVIAAKLVNAIPEFFERHKAHFFMYDLDERNKERFDIAWADMTEDSLTTP